jgi:hypothetical protein
MANKLVETQTIIVKALKLLQQFTEETIKKYIGENGFKMLPEVAKTEMQKLVLMENHFEKEK